MISSDKSIEVHMFWAYGELALLEKLAAVSFVANGFDLKLYTYGSINNLPGCIQQCDAREIIPEHRVFKYKNGSYAGFANLFRYAILCKRGGLWADTDVICLTSVQKIKAIGSNGFLVSERLKTQNTLKINNNLIYHPDPKKGDIIDLAYAVSDRYQVEKLEWGDCGPTLLTALVRAYPKLAPKIMKPEFANHINYWDCPMKLLTDSGGLPKNTFFLHCFNEMWRMQGVDKNQSYPPNSILGKLLAQYKDLL
jgi:hypothetical protein